MDHKLLKELAYDWEKDRLSLKVDDLRPANRCYHCGRVVLNLTFIDAYCRDCSKSMSMCRDGPDHDYDNFANGKIARDRRETLEPVPFDMEDVLKRAAKDNFKLANGKPVATSMSEEDIKEAERLDRLFRLK